jgi:hypothetical protein
MKRFLGMRVGGPAKFFRAMEILCLVGLVLIPCCLFVVGWMTIGRPHAEFTNEPLSLPEFYERSGHEGGLPVTATNLFYARSTVGFRGMIRLYRFDAPVADCIAYGKHLLEQNGQAPELTPFTPSREPPETPDAAGRDKSGLGQVDWFDAKTIRTGLVGLRKANPAKCPRAKFWIDTERGRFYFSEWD